MLFKVNNVQRVTSIFPFNVNLHEEILRRLVGRVEPYEAFFKARRLLGTFLEVDHPFMSFQELQQSIYASENTSMVPSILRCFRDMVGVIYKIGEKKAVILYQLYEEEFVVAQMGAPQGELLTPNQEANDLEGIRFRRHRLRRVLEVDERVIAHSNLHDIFFLRKDVLCLMIGSEMVICRISGLAEQSIHPNTEYKTEYYRVKIRGNETRNLNIRKFRLDRIRECLYYQHGKEISNFNVKKAETRFAEKMEMAGSIDITDVSNFLNELDFGSEKEETVGEEELKGKPSIRLDGNQMDEKEPSILMSTSRNLDE